MSPVPEGHEAKEQYQTPEGYLPRLVARRVPGPLGRSRARGRSPQEGQEGGDEKGRAKRTGNIVWGKSADRRRFGDKHWSEPLKWNRQAERDGSRHLVFCASMADVFEARADHAEDRARLWALIDATPHLTWQLLDIPAPVRFLSMEPLLGPVTLAPWLRDGIGWVIVGGESGPRHRALDLENARVVRDECDEARVPFLFKQVGGHHPTSGGDLLDGRTHKEFPA